MEPVDLDQDPFSALHAERPALAQALAARPVDGDTLDAAAALLLAADPRLVDLLLPAVPDGPLLDQVGEDPRAELLSADVWLEGTTLVGRVEGPAVAREGARLEVDVANGPAPDVEIALGRGWVRYKALDGGISPLPGRDVPIADGNGLSFRVELGDRVQPGHGGSAVASVRSFDGLGEDVGPAGLLGEPPTEGLDVLLGLLQAPVSDADLAVSIAVTFGSLRPLVADGVVGEVDDDALAWLTYGQSIDGWLEAADADWRLGTLDALGKLLWAWPAAQGAVYGAVPLAGQVAPLTVDRWRFVVPGTDTLADLRDAAPLGADAADTARLVDVAVNARLRYRAHDALMAELCRNETIPKSDCEGWQADAKVNANLGLLDGAPVPLWEGTSAALQLAWARTHGAYVGDCATATALTITTLQALGIPALGMGWSGQDLGTPTHDVPLWFDGERLRGTQRGPGREWAKEKAFVYVTLPAVHPVNAWTLAREPGGWSRGGSVVGGWTSYGDVVRVLRDGLPEDVLGGWVDAQARGEWAELTR